MGLSGSDPALMYAQADVARAGATRFGYHSPKAFVSVGGEYRGYSSGYNIKNLSVIDKRGASQASFDVIGNAWTPAPGMEVICTLGSKNRIKRLFGGTALTVAETNVGELRKSSVGCVDWNWLLDGEPIYGHFTGTADEIAIELMSYAPAGMNFTTRQVETGLSTVTGGFTVTGVKLSEALKRLAKRASVPGAVVTQFIDYNLDLYFRVTPSTALTNPTDIVVGLDSFKKFAVSRDLTQVINRVPFEGGGANALADVSVGETILPVVTAPDWWYGDVGGVVISGPQKITYTARVEGGGGSVVGPGVSPSNAPTAAVAAGSGVDSGSHVISFVWKTASGRTLPGATTTIVVGLVSPPSSAVTAGAPSNGAGLDAGDHRYYPVFRTPAGSTTAGSASNTVTAIAGVSAPVLPGSGFFPEIQDSSVGVLLPGNTYIYKVGFRRNSDGAETTPSGASPTFSPGSLKYFAWFRLSELSVPSGYSLVVYRQKNGSGNFQECTDMQSAMSNWGSGPEPSAYDNTADASLGASAPSVNGTFKGVCAVSGIPVSPSALVTHVDMYREFNGAGAATAKLAFSVSNGTTSGSDTTANSGLGATVPSSNTATANQIAVSGIAVGPSGTTEREVYMSPVGGGTRRLALTIANNTATTGTITMSDATLAGQLAEPSVDGSGLTQPSGQVLPGATSCVVAGTAPFLSAGGWAFTGTQQFRYTGFTGASLTGIPPSGAGSITQPINYNTTIAAAPCLIGVPSSGAGSILYTIPKGDSVNCFVTVEDEDAQVALQTLLSASAPVVRECPPLQDRRLKRDEALTRASAFLTARAYPSTSVGPYLSKDMNNGAGALVNISIAAPMSVNDEFQCQTVTINNFTNNLPPDYWVSASDEVFSVEDLLSREPG